MNMDQKVRKTLFRLLDNNKHSFVTKIGLKTFLLQVVNQARPKLNDPDAMLRYVDILVEEFRN